METPHRQLMENLILENQNFYTMQLNSQDENFQLFKRMVLLCSEKISTLDSSTSSSINLEGCVKDRAIEDHAAEDTLKGFSPNIRTVKTIHWPHLPLNPFDMHFFNTPAYVLEFSQPITLEELRALKVFYQKSQE